MRLSECKRCSLSKTRLNVVKPRGSTKSRIVFVGEAPGKNEDKIGKPFIGKSGYWMDRILKSLGLSSPNDYFITNVIQCRPVDSKGNNGKPTIGQILKCAPILNIQLNRVRPNLIIVMGGYAKDRLLNIPGPIGNYAGQLFWSEVYKNIFVMYHPATLVYNKKKYKPIFKKHLKILKRIIRDMDIMGEKKYWKKIGKNDGVGWLT